MIQQNFLGTIFANHSASFDSGVVINLSSLNRDIERKIL